MATNSWLNREEYPFKPNYFQVNGHNMHYIDEGAGEVILFVHGTPSWSFDFRHLIKAFSKTHRCIAIDHIGFGLSDKPENYDYSTQNHSRTLEAFILEKNLHDITLVVHDFGGPIGLSVAIKHPERIKKLVIMNSWMWSSEAEADFIKLSRVLRSPFLPFLYRWLNFSPRFVLPASFGEKKLDKMLLSQYTRPFANGAQRNGCLAFAKSLLSDQQWFQQLWNNRASIANKPTLFVWGMADPVIKPRYLAKFQQGFVNSRAVQLGTCGHFPQEEEPKAVLSAVSGFLSIG